MENLSGDMDEVVFSYCKKPILVLGVGNILFGDDGFGPEVIKELKSRDDVPEEVHLLDAETSVRNILINILMVERTPDLIIVIDSVNKGRPPGEVFEIDIDAIPFEKTEDFQLHFAPTSNMLKDLKEGKGLDVIVIACEAEYIPEENMEVRLSDNVREAVPVAADLVLKRVREHLAPDK